MVLYKFLYRATTSDTVQLSQTRGNRSESAYVCVTTTSETNDLLCYLLYFPEHYTTKIKTTKNKRKMEHKKEKGEQNRGGGNTG